MKILFPIFSTLLLMQFSVAADSPTVLLAKDAKLNGAVSFDAKTDAIRNWRQEDSSASWVINLPAGSYKVSMKYSLDRSSTGGRFQMATESSKAQVNTIYPTGSWNEFKERNFVPVEISNSDKTFTITATKIPLKRWLMDLKSVTLTKSN
jgi:hypothetical protein